MRFRRFSPFPRRPTSEALGYQRLNGTRVDNPTAGCVRGTGERRYLFARANLASGRRSISASSAAQHAWARRDGTESIRASRRSRRGSCASGASRVSDVLSGNRRNPGTRLSSGLSDRSTEQPALRVRLQWMLGSLRGRERSCARSHIHMKESSIRVALVRHARIDRCSPDQQRNTES
jgi:hypothetical protein